MTRRQPRESLDYDVKPDEHARSLSFKIGAAIMQYMREEGLTLLQEDDIEIIRRALAITNEEFL
jgi:hypothetical protein